MRRLLYSLMVLVLISMAVHAAVGDFVHPERFIDLGNSAGELWIKMGGVLMDRLYDSSLGLFRETWGTFEGQRWYWNTEQGEALQLLAPLVEERTPLADEARSIILKVFQSYRQYLAIELGDVVYPMTRYVSDGPVLVDDSDPSDGDIEVRNLIVNIGGDVCGVHPDSNWKRLLVLYNDLYDRKIWEVGYLRSWEVWYRYPINVTVCTNTTNPETNTTETVCTTQTVLSENDYHGIWDQSPYLQGCGVSSDGCVYRVMSDGNLTYEVRLCLERDAPWIDAVLTVRNSMNETAYDVMVTLALDALDRIQYKFIWVSKGGSWVFDVANGTEQWFATAGDPVDYFVLYVNRSIGMLRAIAVVFPGGRSDVDLWVYNTRQWPDYTWYFMWFKMRFHLGDIPSGGSRTITFRIVPISSFAPEMWSVYDYIFRNLDSFKHHDISFAVNTGTGVFKGFAMGGIVTAAHYSNALGFAEALLRSVNEVFAEWNYTVSTRTLSNFILACLKLYDYTRNPEWLSIARRAAETVLASQIRDPSDPRDGGFLDIPPPIGSGTYLDVNAEAMHALVELYLHTGDGRYLEAIEYLWTHWFRYDPSSGRWYYYRFTDPSHPWYRGYMDEKEPFAQGYFLQAAARLAAVDIRYALDNKTLVSLSRIMRLLSDEAWELTWDGASETNVETQSSTALGLYMWSRVLQGYTWASFQYVRGAEVVNATFIENGGMLFSLDAYSDVVTMAIRVSKSPIYVYVNNMLIQLVKSLDVLDSLSYGAAFFYDNATGVVYIKASGLGERLDVAVVYRLLPVATTVVTVVTTVVFPLPNIPPLLTVGFPELRAAGVGGLLSLGFVVAMVTAAVMLESSIPRALALAGGPLLVLGVLMNNAGMISVGVGALLFALVLTHRS